ncbi:MAG: hypothetical protein HY332_07405 [Chloroflexi bacterium]|nr:hypothetical protein [Chloroflexota bacterium]
MMVMMVMMVNTARAPPNVERLDDLLPNAVADSPGPPPTRTVSRQESEAEYGDTLAGHFRGERTPDWLCA